MATYEEIHRKVDRLRKESKLPPEERDRILSAYEDASIANMEIGIRNRARIMADPGSYPIEVEDKSYGPFFDDDNIKCPFCGKKLPPMEHGWAVRCKNLLCRTRWARYGTTIRRVIK